MHLASPSILLAAAVSAAVGWSLPEVQRAAFPPPMEIHELTVGAPCEAAMPETPCVVQDRTVQADGAFFYAGWRAAVLHADTRLPVPGCAGAGVADYPAGRARVALPLPTWLGAPGCTLQQLQARYGRDHELVLAATWHWGDDQTTHVSEPFTLAEVLPGPVD